jgi:TolB-like protein/Tfp pilus assembly protein PilF
MSGDDDGHAATLFAPPPPPASVIREGTAGAVVLAGRYEVLALLGVGGMGAVYRARDLELDEVVALKMLRRELLDVPGMLERFRQEVKLARKVTSPYVARTFDIGEHEGEKFLTMELVDGESLADEMDRVGPMAIERVLAIASNVCSGLAAAHAAAVVHRDLKPENVLLGRDGGIKITDFGIATAHADVRSTQGISGTPAYMAPEQVTGDAKIDARADLYAFGLVLYEMLTHELPWKGDTALVVASARLFAPPPDVRALRPEVPSELAELILRCMAKDREQRPAGASELLASLSRLARASAPPPPLRGAPAPPAPPPLPLLAPSTHGKSIAVLPLRNRSAADDDYLADGLTDDLIDSLSMVRGIRVCSRGAVMRFKGEERDPREIGRALGVNVFVDGTVRRDGALVRVSVRLASIDDAFQLWAKRFDRPAGDLLSVSDEIAQAIAGALSVEVAEKSSAPRDPAVVDLYLRARHAYFTFGVAATERAVTLFEEALAIAPDDPLILAGAAMAQMAFISMHPSEGQGSRKARAEAVAERAVAIAPDLADGHIALANLRLHDGRGREAVKESLLAMAAAPSNAEAHYLIGRFYAESGSTTKALAQLEIASSLDPRLDLVTAEIARVHALLGEWDVAEARLARMMTNEADSPFVYWGNMIRFRMWERNPAKDAPFLAAAHASAGLQKANIAGLLRVLERQDSTAYQAELVQLRLLPNSRRRRAFFAQLAAEINAYNGLGERCLQSLALADDLGLTDALWIDRCPLFDFVREDPRFVEARVSIGARAAEILEALV